MSKRHAGEKQALTWQSHGASAKQRMLADLHGRSHDARAVQGHAGDHLGSVAADHTAGSIRSQPPVWRDVCCTPERASLQSAHAARLLSRCTAA